MHYILSTMLNRGMLVGGKNSLLILQQFSGYKKCASGSRKRHVLFLKSCLWVSPCKRISNTNIFWTSTKYNVDFFAAILILSTKYWSLFTTKEDSKIEENDWLHSEEHWSHSKTNFLKNSKKYTWWAYYFQAWWKSIFSGC